MREHYRRVAPLAENLARVEDVSAEGLAQLDRLHTGGLAASRMTAKLAMIGRALSQHSQTKRADAAVRPSYGFFNVTRLMAAEGSK